MKTLLITVACCLLIGCSPDKSNTDLSPTKATRAMVIACLNHDFDEYKESFSTNIALQQEYISDDSMYTLGAEANLNLMFNKLSDTLNKYDCTINDALFSVRSNDDLPSRWKLKPEFRWVDIEFKNKVILAQPFLVHLENGTWKMIDRSHAHNALQNEM